MACRAAVGKGETTTVTGPRGEPPTRREGPGISPSLCSHPRHVRPPRAWQQEPQDWSLSSWKGAVDKLTHLSKG